jgi:hypothetical protein
MKPRIACDNTWMARSAARQLQRKLQSSASILEAYGVAHLRWRKSGLEEIAVAEVMLPTLELFWRI